jgi:tRNA nucleotidyltransferase (CCA-adding enzyme)
VQNGTIKLPSAVSAALERLERAGFDAFAVGGCVRDSIIGRVPNDWDITTSARPEETAAVFADLRTIETGIKHGTLTVLYDGMPLEITTFRNDGVYEDNRHPVEVTFSERVEDDLARRDFTVNAMAYHPKRGIVDLFFGREDLSRRVISCVGDPETRFCEDGLRILRAIRFAAVLDFSIDPATAGAVHKLSYLLKNIAAERIREEFCKLICGRGAVRILREFSDVIAQFLPEMGQCVGFLQNSKYHCYDVYEHSIRALDFCESDDLMTRLAIFFHDVGKPHCYTEDADGGHFKGHGPIGTELCDAMMKRLRFDNDTRVSVVRLVEYHDSEIPAEERSVKRLMRKMSDGDILRLMEVKRCDRLAHAPAYCTPSPALEQIPLLVRSIREADACLSLKTLKIGGGDLIAMGMRPGKALGALLDELLERVIDGELENDADALKNAARERIGK